MSDDLVVNLRDLIGRVQRHVRGGAGDFIVASQPPQPTDVDVLANEAIKAIAALRAERDEARREAEWVRDYYDPPLAPGETRTGDPPIRLPWEADHA